MNPLIIIGSFLGGATTLMFFVFARIKEKKEAFGFDRNMKDSLITKRLAGYARPYLKSFVFVLFLMAVTVAADIILPLIIGHVTSLLGGEMSSFTPVLKDVLLYIGVLLASLGCTYVQAVALQTTGQKIISNIREETFSHIQKFSHERHNEIPVGTLVTRVTNDTNAMSMMFTHIVVNLIKNICLIFGIFAAMLLVNVKLTLLVLCVSPFILAFTVIFRKFSRRAYRHVKTNTTNINVFLSENLSGMKITQLFNQEETKKNQFEAKNKALEKSKNEQIFVFGIFRPSVYMLYIFTVICLFYIAGTSAVSGVSFAGQIITYSTIVIFYQYVAAFFTPIQNLAEQFNFLQSAYASAEKIFTILDTTPGLVDSVGAEDIKDVIGSVEFKNVWFAYKEGEWVLKDVSFKVEPKQTAAFVGPTGAGKTTILSLVCRNYDIQKGEILIDGRDIRGITISSLRRNIGQMLQDVFIFSGTVRSNLLLRETNFTESEVISACESVNAYPFISKLKNGLDEEVREMGNNFSAGQRQLISFARTVLHKPSLMILDEATANIDTETELLIQDSLLHMMNIGTMLIVAHRLSTIQHADKIIFLSHGEIAEEGNHEELLKRKGKYYDLYKLQYSREEIKKRL